MCDFEEICGNFSTALFSFISSTVWNRRLSEIYKFREQGKSSGEKWRLWGDRGVAGVLFFARNWMERAHRARDRCHGFLAKFPAVSHRLTPIDAVNVLGRIIDSTIFFKISPMLLLWIKPLSFIGDRTLFDWEEKSNRIGTVCVSTPDHHADVTSF